MAAVTLPPWSHECEPCRRADTEGWTGLSNAAHCHDCHRTWTGHRELHCPVCCRHFGAVSASDMHDGPDGCLDPAALRDRQGKPKLKEVPRSHGPVWVSAREGVFAPRP